VNPDATEYESDDLFRLENFVICEFCLFPAASSRRDWRSMRTRPRMTEKGTNFVRGLGREDVFEFARLLLDLRLAI
jgi:hypothetical protein